MLLILGLVALAGGATWFALAPPAGSTSPDPAQASAQKVASAGIGGLTQEQINQAAQAADATFGSAVATVSTAIGASFPAAIPYLAAAGTATALAWSRVTKLDKAKVWTGKK